MPINPGVAQKSDIIDKLFKYLQSLGYQTSRDAQLTGKSSIEHSFDLLARAEDGLINSSLVIRIVGPDLKEKQSHAIFNFANKAYDVGIPERIMVTIPDFHQKSIRLARQWNIRIFNAKKVEAITAKTPANKPFLKTPEPIEFGNLQEMSASLIRRGYQVREKAIITGVSGVTYQFDLLASISTALWDHNVGIDFLSNSEEVSLEQVSVFDTKAYDSGIITKIIVAKPGLNFNAKLFAGRQRIKVFELGCKPEVKSTLGEIKEFSGSTTSDSGTKLSLQPEAVHLIPMIDRSSGIFSEIETNLKIATDLQVNRPVSFKTNLWDSKHIAINELPANIRSELGEVYNKMVVVNNLVWLITEIGDSTGELSATYSEMCRGIALRLAKILE